MLLKVNGGQLKLYVLCLLSLVRSCWGVGLNWLLSLCISLHSAFVFCCPWCCFFGTAWLCLVFVATALSAWWFLFAADHSLTSPPLSFHRLPTLACAPTFTSKALWLAHRRSTLGCEHTISVLTLKRTWAPGWGPWTRLRWCRTTSIQQSGMAAPPPSHYTWVNISYLCLTTILQPNWTGLSLTPPPLQSKQEVHAGSKNPEEESDTFLFLNMFLIIFFFLVFFL